MARYLGRVAVWQAADWGLRFLTIWFLLAAFHIPQTLENAALAQASTSVSTLLPITPAGIVTLSVRGCTRTRPSSPSCGDLSSIV